MTLRDLLRTALVTVTVAPILHAVEPPVGQSMVRFDDAKLAMKVKAAFGADRDVGGLNLFVSVLDGVVAVQGPVSNETVKDRIRDLATAVPGVATVKVDCFVISEEDPLKREIAKRLAPVPKGETPKAIPVATGHLPSIAVGPPTLSIAPPTTDDLPSFAGADSTVTVQRPVETTESARSMVMGGLLSAPVTASVSSKAVVVSPLPNAPSAPRPYSTIPPPNVPILPVGMKAISPEEIAFALIDLRKSDSRFAGINATLVNGVVTISGKGDAEAVESFIVASKQLMGVVRVEIR